MTTRILVLDAGNSRLKWAVLDDALNQSHALQTADSHARVAASLNWLDHGAADYDHLADLPASWQQWGAFSACYAVNVAGDSIGIIVQQLVAHLGLQPIWLKASARACGVQNGYTPPASLGADRWAALVAVRQRTREAALVVSAGSALTVDTLNSAGHFLGGLIVPGLHMMRTVLAASTAQVGTQYGKVSSFPNTTADAVESGLVAAIIGAIETMHNQLDTLCTASTRIFLTGGDADTLKPYLPPDTLLIPGLVLEGVYYLSREDQLT